MKLFHLFLAGSAWTVATAGATESTHHHHTKNRIPTFSTRDVLEGRVDTALADIWQSTGILALSIKEEEEERHASASSFSTIDALQGLCECQSALQDYHHARQEQQQQQHDQSSPQVIQHAPLHDDATTWRTTLATATVGTTPLPLWLHNKDKKEHSFQSSWPCSSDTFMALEELRDRVSGATQVFLHALDRYLARHRATNHDDSLYLMRHAYGGGYHTVAELQAAGNHLEHFHIYDKAASSSSHKATSTTLGDSGSTPFQEEIEDEQDHEDSSRPPTLNWHTDAGLFLSFVPAVNCHGDENDDDSSRMTVDDSFVLPNGQRAIFEDPNHIVVFMLGAGAQHWLQLPQNHKNNDKPLLQATRHAVHMPAGQVRAWYGMMTLVPDIAIVQEHPEPQTFGDMKQRLSQHAAARRQGTSSSLSSTSRRRRTSRTSPVDTNQNDDHLFSWTPATQRTLSIGCGAYTPVHELLLEEELEPTDTQQEADDKDQLLWLGGRRLRADHVQSPNACNNSTNFFCWMSCMDIPDAGRIEERLNDGQSLYCMDPAIYDGTAHHKVKAATEPCAQGHVHNANCLGQWAPTAHGVTPYDFPQYDHHHSTNDDPHNHDPDDANSTSVDFCYGGTSMYMDGFHWTDTTCVIYLFPEWVLSTQGKLAAAGIGTVVFGAGLEWVIYWRRWTMTSLSSSTTSRPLRMVASGLFYGLQLSMGYMLMLVIMTYSGVLFFCTIMGLVMGHVLFNSKDAVFAHKKKPHEQENDITPSEGEGTKNGRPAHGTGLAATMSTTRSAGSSRFLHLHAFQSQRMNGGSATDDEEVGTATLDTTNPSTTCPCNGDGSSGGGSSHNDTAANNDLIVDDSSLLAATTTTTKPSRTPTAETDWNIPEGATPCCQNEL